MDDGIAIIGAILIPMRELGFRTSRSGGPGGQHVNMTDSRVELMFDVMASTALGEGHKRRLLERLRTRIDTRGVLHLVSQEHRSQHQNKDEVVRRFQELLRGALRPVKKRVATKPSGASRERRIESKKRRGEAKSRRRGPGEEG